MQIYRRTTVGLCLTQFTLEFSLRSRVRFSELNLEITEIETSGHVRRNTVLINGFVFPGTKILGERDAAIAFKSEVQFVNVSGVWCVSCVELTSTGPKVLAHCEYSNTPSSSAFNYPSHLCMKKGEGESAHWEVMDTDSCEVTSLMPMVYEVKEHTPQIHCKNCGRESPAHFFRKVYQEKGAHLWVCPCTAG